MVSRGVALHRVATSNMHGMAGKTRSKFAPACFHPKIHHFAHTSCFYSIFRFLLTNCFYMMDVAFEDGVLHGAENHTPPPAIYSDGALNSREKVLCYVESFERKRERWLWRLLSRCGTYNSVQLNVMRN